MASASLFYLKKTELFSVYELKSEVNPTPKDARPNVSIISSSETASSTVADVPVTTGIAGAVNTSQLWQFDKAFFPSASRNANKDENLSEASARIINQIQASKDEATTLPNDTIKSFPEDWQLSQFWYSPDTADILARAISQRAGNTGAAAVVSAPTLFCAMKHLRVPNFSNMVLLEYDPRFRSFGSQFCRFDYNYPVKLPPRYKHAFSTVYVDPPFRSQECIEKSVETAKFLAKPDSQGRIDVMFCTGERFESLIQHLLGARMSDYRPTHTSKLANPCRLYLTAEPEVTSP